MTSGETDRSGASIKPLPAVLRAWSRVGAAVPIGRRLQVSRLLTRRLISGDTAYRTPQGFAFEADPDDRFQPTMLVGLHDPDLEAVIRRFTPAGGTVVDGGAHLGYFTMMMAQLVGPKGSVHSFECDPRVVPRLRAHLELNGLSWVTLNARGLLDRELDDQPVFLPEQLGWASATANTWGATDSAVARMTTLDHYVVEAGLDPARISFFKLDVEGAELAALRGATETLQQTDSPVLVEYLPDRMRAQGEDPAELLGLMEGFGYHPWRLTTRRRGLRLLQGAEPMIGEDLLFLKGQPEP
jgi:FkbM family methyltransferase